MSKIIPTILTDSVSEYQNRFEILKSLTNRIQVDFMDGDFVDTHSIRPDEIPDSVLDYTNKLMLEAHLMVEDPMKWLNKLNTDFNFAYIHFETKRLKDGWSKWQEEALLKGIRLGLAINPETPISALKNITPLPEAILILGVNPGRLGQEILPDSIDKIKEAKEIFPCPIGLDGGVNKSNIESIVKTGADFIYIGSALKTDDLVKDWQELNKLTQI